MTSIIQVNTIQNEAGTISRPIQDFAHRTIQRVSYTHRNGWIRGDNTYYWMPGGYADFTPIRSDSRIRSHWNIHTRDYGSNHMIMHYVFYRDDIEYGRHTRGGHEIENTNAMEWDIPSWGAGQKARMGYRYRSYSDGNHNAHLFHTEWWDGGGSGQSVPGQYTIVEYVPKIPLNTADMPHSQQNMQNSTVRSNGTGGAGSAASDGMSEDRQRGLSFGWHSSPAVFPGICAVYMGNKYPNGVVVNQLKLIAHANHLQAFTIQGSNDSGQGANFHNAGNWTTIITGDGGGPGSAFDRQALDYQSTNTTPYLAYRIVVTSGGTGWASFGWELYGY
jgi:hypothetical protein